MWSSSGSMCNPNGERGRRYYALDVLRGLSIVLMVFYHWGYDLVLCGHGHGGIIRIPILDKGLLSSNRTLFPKYDGGVYTFDNGFVCCVSRGLGSNTVPIHAFRLFNRPDLPILVLQSEEK